MQVKSIVKKPMYKIVNRFLIFLGSRKAFYLILGIFGFQALWIALFSRFPMAFDEQVHYGIIKLHTTSWLPFFNSVPAYANEFGPVARDPSFLFYYLLSFPLRLIALFTGSMTTQIIVLRLLNIGLVLAGLMVFRKLLLRLGLNALRSNIILAFFCLIPIFPLMAGQISYDNLTFLGTAVVLLLGVVFLQRYKADGKIDAGVLTGLILAGTFTSLVKYPFLPVFVAVLLCVGYVIFRNFDRSTRAYLGWWKHLATKFKVVVITGFIVGAGLFAGSYGLNMLRYHTPVPKCDKVLSINECRVYAPWIRDYQASLSHTGVSNGEVVHYFPDWVRQMMRETFFMVTSNYDSQDVVQYRVTKPLPVLYVTAWVLFIIGTLAILLNVRFLWTNPAYRLIMVAFALYSAALLKTNLSLFLHTGVPVAIHGRYLIPLMIPLIGLAVICAGRLLQRLPSTNLTRDQLRAIKVGLLVIVFACCLQGGGLVSYVIATDDGWMWQQSQPAKDINQAAREFLNPLVYQQK